MKKESKDRQARGEEAILSRTSSTQAQLLTVILKIQSKGIAEVDSREAISSKYLSTMLSSRQWEPAKHQAHRLHLHLAKCP
jgi:hypothetical protein